MDQRRPIYVHMVSPQPGPRAAAPESAHVILDHSDLRYEPRVSALLSVTRHGFETFSALSVPPQVSHDSLIWFAGLSSDCLPMGPFTCTCRSGAMELVDVLPGALFRLAVLDVVPTSLSWG